MVGPKSIAAGALLAALLLVIPNTAPGFEEARFGVVAALTLAGFAATIVAIARLEPFRPERYAKRWHRRLILGTVAVAWLALAGYGWLWTLFLASPAEMFRQRDLAMVVSLPDGGATANLYYHMGCFLGCQFEEAELAVPIGPFERTLWRGERPTRVDARSWFHIYTIVIHDGAIRASIDGRPATVQTFQVFEEKIF